MQCYPPAFSVRDLQKMHIKPDKIRAFEGKYMLAKAQRRSYGLDKLVSGGHIFIHTNDEICPPFVLFP